MKGFFHKTMVCASFSLSVRQVASLVLLLALLVIGVAAPASTDGGRHHNGNRYRPAMANNGCAHNPRQMCRQCRGGGGGMFRSQPIRTRGCGPHGIRNCQMCNRGGTVFVRRGRRGGGDLGNLFGAALGAYTTIETTKAITRAARDGDAGGVAETLLLSQLLGNGAFGGAYIPGIQRGLFMDGWNGYGIGGRWSNAYQNIQIYLPNEDRWVYGREALQYARGIYYK